MSLPTLSLYLLSRKKGCEALLFRIIGCGVKEEAAFLQNFSLPTGKEYTRHNVFLNPSILMNTPLPPLKFTYNTLRKIFQHSL